jgi:SAM-dependent methyltransferase
MRLEEWLTAWAGEIPDGARVLDAGSGVAPYRRLFEHTAYQTADFLKVEKRYEPPTYICDLTDIPVPDRSFDYIVCTQVLEHVPNPSAVMQEFFRVAEIGGIVLLTAPLFYEEHEQPYDFFRYTRFGLARLAEEARFTVVEIEPLEGYFGTLSYQLAMAARELRRDNSHGRGILPFLAVSVASRAVFSLLAKLFARLEPRQSIVDTGMCKNYRCVFTKGDPQPGQSTDPGERCSALASDQ